jgi:vancomycin permeability regulator SanA
MRLFIRTLIAFLAAGFIGCAVLVGDGLIDDIQPADAAVVLGSKVMPDGKPSARLQARLDRAADLFHQGTVRFVIVSGGTGIEGFSEGRVMAAALEEAGVPAQAILVDEEGNTTRATATNAARIMKERGFASALVVSQYFHVSRSRLALERAGISPVHSAHAEFFELRDIYSIAREAVALPAYWLSYR